MNANEELLRIIWSDVHASLEIMKGFSKGEIKPENMKMAAKHGTELLARAEKELGKLTGLGE